MTLWKWLSLVLVTAGVLTVGCRAGKKEAAAAVPSDDVPAVAAEAAEPVEPTGPTDPLEPARPVEPAGSTEPVQQQRPAAPAAPAPAKPAQAQKGAAEEEPYDIQEHAFPPTLSDTEWHENAWLQDDCLRCHETGVGDAPVVRHRKMPSILLTAKCRTCHVQIPGSEPIEPAPRTEEEQQFSANAFPPMIPASASHTMAWIKDDCLLCHETGTKGAPVTVHQGLPEIYKQAKCRSCHVQVRAVEAGPK